MEKPIEFDEVINGLRVTVGEGPTDCRHRIVPLEAPYAYTDKIFEGGRDAPPTPDDNAFTWFAFGMPPAKVHENEYVELKAEAAAIRDQIHALEHRHSYLAQRISALKPNSST
ncbi:MAG: hypothetical protein EPN91_12880 [Salinibacterium sp.]|nr:MAG: hypothetical protein EPN91_12880 [Salinibacterium sp.]